MILSCWESFFVVAATIAVAYTTTSIPDQTGFVEVETCKVSDVDVHVACLLRKAFSY